MSTRPTLLLTAAGGALALAVSGLAASVTTAAAGSGGDPHDLGLTPVAELVSPRGVDALGHGRTLVTEGDGSFSLVIEKHHGPAKVIELGTLGGDFAPAIAAGRWGTVWLLTGASGGPPEEESGDPAAAPRSLTAETSGEPPEGPLPTTLYKWRPGWDHPVPVADIGAYQAEDPDPFDQEGFPEDSNPFGLAALRDGSVLVADAAGNDLLRVWPGHHGKDAHIVTVARLKPRLVEVPEGLPDLPPPDGPLPPAGTPILSEAVATSVAVGADGYWYVGELRGFPATPGTSQVWRIKAGSHDVVCDPEKPWAPGRCKRFADGLTSIVDLAGAPHGVLAVSLSKKSWFQWELGVEGSEIGGLFHVRYWGHHGHGPRIKELVKDQLPNPAGVDATWRDIYVTAPIFGPGALWKVD
jgi:hypothetical protein